MALIKAWERKLLGKGNGNSAVEGALGLSRQENQGAGKKPTKRASAFQSFSAKAHTPICERKTE